MKTLERLPNKGEQWTTPNQMMADGGYTSGKMSVNGPSMIHDHVFCTI
jgi:hypothetical protein